MKRALFLDRDGIVDELVYYESSGEWEAPRTVEDLVMLDVEEALRRFVEAGWLLFLVTNQPSAAKGKVSRESLERVQEEVLRRLPLVTRGYVCFHRAEDRCGCRKPSPFFLHEAAREFDVDLSQSWMVGDQDSDLQCGRAAGCKVALIEHPRSAHKRGSVSPDVVVGDLGELAALTLGGRR
ncbi:MAG TPA: HAD-IIIA family hydrolase [Thermoanaerobaculia bacterium]|nr:HAD-IIIA family hydrolase [Thermoanaerobaculia bacterium]